MSCNPIFRALAEVNPLLPSRFARRMDEQWLEPHRRRCTRCRTHHQRFQRLDQLFNELPAAEPLTAVAGISRQRSERHALPPSWVRIAVAGAAVLAFCVTTPMMRGTMPRLPPEPTGEVRSTHEPPAVSVPADRHLRKSGPQQQAATSSGQPRRIRTAYADGARLRPTETRPMPPVAVLPDETYLNGADPALSQCWLEGERRDARLEALWRKPLPPMKDDFVQPPPVLLADSTGKSAADAAKKYTEAAKVVDERLFWKVTLALKAASLEEFCAEMEKQTGVTLRASRGVRDEKVTVFVDHVPARDVMREITRLFGFFWGRVGEPGAYKYDLEQNLRAQLIELEMRQKDRDAAILRLDEQMAQYRPYLEMSRKELEAAGSRAQGAEKDLIRQFLDHRAPILVYHHLTPQDRLTLLNGQVVRFVRNASDADHRLPEEWYPAGEADRQVQGGAGGPGAQPFVGLSLDRSEAGQLKLLQSEGGATESGPDGRPSWGGVTLLDPLAIGMSPSTSEPQNAAMNRAVRVQPEFRRLVSFAVKPSCPWFTPEAIQAQAKKSPSSADEINHLRDPHVSSGDMWEAVHHATGMNIVADAYSRYYPAAPFSYKNVPLFDALCRAGDALGVRWRKDGDFILARSTSYFWDKLKEVPNRLLTRWQEDRRQKGSVPLDDVLEMATLTDTQLDSEISGKVIQHCWQLEEWGAVGRGLFRPGIDCTELRPFARFLATLSPAQRRLAETRGLEPGDLLPAQAEALVRVLQAKGMALSPRARLRVDFAPAGTYLYDRPADSPGAAAAPVVWAKTAEEALAAARRVDPSARPDQVRPCHGLFGVTLIMDGGIAWKFRNEGGD